MLLEVKMFENMLVKDWMSGPVETVSPSTLLSKAHQMMLERRIRRLPVMENDRLVGIITIGDVREASPSDATTLSIWELNYLWAQLTIGKIMTRKVLTITPDEPVIKAAQIMLEHKVGGLPVVDAGSKLVGIITESDIFRMLVKLQSAVTNP
jgi:CBS domain-containing protein